MRIAYFEQTADSTIFGFLDIVYISRESPSSFLKDSYCVLPCSMITEHSRLKCLFFSFLKIKANSVLGSGAGFTPMKLRGVEHESFCGLT